MISLIPALAAASSEWDRFRGPNGTGISADTNIPVEFGTATNVVWKTDLPDGNSSPVFGRDAIFVTGYECEKLFTISLDRESDRVKWRCEIERKRQGSLRNPNKPAAPSPATDESNAFVFFQDLGMLAYSPDGNELW